MSLLYKKPEDFIYDVDIEQENGKVNLKFYNDSGKHHTYESLDEFDLTPKELLDILQEWEEKQLNEEP